MPGCCPSLVECVTATVFGCYISSVHVTKRVAQLDTGKRYNIYYNIPLQSIAVELSCLPWTHIADNCSNVAMPSHAYIRPL